MEINGTTRWWYAVYTKPRWEKKVHRLLAEKKIESYCPLNRVYRKWSDRIKVVEEPLFKSYVFVRVSEEEKGQVRLVDGILNFVYWCGKPAIVRDKDIEVIRLFLQEHTQVELLPIPLHPGQLIKIPHGVFMGEEAEVVTAKKRYAIVTIKSLGYRLRARLDFGPGGMLPKKKNIS